MTKKNTLIFIDGNKVKIVYGNKLKIISFEEIQLDYNQEFLDQIFYNTSVLTVDNISLLDRESFNKITWSIKQTDPVKEQTEEPIKEVKEQSSLEKIISDPAGPPKVKHLEGFIPQPGGDVYIVSTSEVTMIIDDLYTKNKINRGGAMVQEATTLPPGKPINLSSLDQDSLKSSYILKRMVQNGTVKQVSFEEAMELNKAYEIKVESQLFSVHDSKNEGQVSFSVGGTSSEVDKLMDSMYDSTSKDTIEITSGTSGTAGTAGASGGNREFQTNENSESMNDLMQMVDQAESEGMIQGQRATRRIR